MCPVLIRRKRRDVRVRRVAPRRCPPRGSAHALPHSPAPALVSRPAAAPRIAAVAGAASLILLALVAARWSPLVSLDRAVADALHRHAVAEPGAVAVSRVLTDWVWDPWTMRALIAVTVVALWWRNARLLALWVAATSLLASLLQQGLKAAVGRERPEWPDPVDSAQYAAYPSGHAMTAVVSCGLLVWLLGLHGGGPGLRWGRRGVALGSAPRCGGRAAGPAGGALG
ncbi:hypothetical protein SCALM49S_08496 [Streptomyces californicus]